MLRETESLPIRVNGDRRALLRGGSIRAKRNGRERASRCTDASTTRHEWTDRACRVLNVAMASILILVCLPIFPIIALLIKLTSPGPLIFAQWRVGLDRRNGRQPVGDYRRRVDWGGRPFRLYKFRTMYVEACNENRQVWASPNDRRVTSVGRILRKYRLDELPQLVNVLLGDMNLVGPRPEQPEIFAHLRTNIEGYPQRQRVLPGITGRAQVRHHYDQSLDDVRRKLELDLEYIERRSVFEDLRIMLETIPGVLLRSGGW